MLIKPLRFSFGANRPIKIFAPVFCLMLVSFLEEKTDGPRVCVHFNHENSLQRVNIEIYLICLGCEENGRVERQVGIS